MKTLFSALAAATFLVATILIIAFIQTEEFILLVCAALYGALCWYALYNLGRGLSETERKMPRV